MQHDTQPLLPADFLVPSTFFRLTSGGLSPSPSRTPSAPLLNCPSARSLGKNSLAIRFIFPRHGDLVPCSKNRCAFSLSALFSKFAWRLSRAKGAEEALFKNLRKKRNSRARYSRRKEKEKFERKIAPFEHEYACSSHHYPSRYVGRWMGILRKKNLECF